MPHKYFVKDVLFDDEDEWVEIRRRKYDDHGRPRSMEERNRAMNEYKERILDNTLQSTRNALNVIRDAEDIGITASIELERQGESLRNINNHVDKMADQLDENKHRINGIESIFYDLKNRITGRSKRRKNKRKPDKNVNAQVRADKGVDNQQSLRLRIDDSVDSKLTVAETQIERNLTEIETHVIHLKDLSLSMNREINAQNTLLDVIQYKIDNSNIEMKSQTERIRKITP